MKVSFDFDGCLEHTIIQNILKMFMKGGAEIFVITSRNIENRNDDLFILCETLNIKKENIYFTNNEFKYEKYFELGIDVHYDDLETEVMEINKRDGCALLYNFDLEFTRYLYFQ